MTDFSKPDYVNFSAADIAEMDSRYRVNFVNSLSGYKSANLIGTVSASGNSNLAIFSSVVHLGADPALVGFINRPHTVERQTLENIQATEVFTINHLHRTMYAQGHHTAARYPADVSEFKQAGFKEHWTGFKAPYVAESRIKFGVQLCEQITLKQNKTILVIGEIKEVFCAHDAMAEDGKIDVQAAGSVAISGLDDYYVGEQLGRLAYAKPNQF